MKLKHNEYSIRLPVLPEAFAVVFGLSEEDCKENFRGIVEQFKAEACGLA